MQFQKPEWSDIDETLLSGLGKSCDCLCEQSSSNDNFVIVKF